MVLAGVASRASPRVAVTVTRSVRAAGTSTTRTSVPGRGVTSTLAKPRAVTVTGSPPPVQSTAPSAEVSAVVPPAATVACSIGAPDWSTTTMRALCADTPVADVSNRTAAVHIAPGSERVWS